MLSRSVCSCMVHQVTGRKFQDCQEMWCHKAGGTEEPSYSYSAEDHKSFFQGQLEKAWAI